MLREHGIWCRFAAQGAVIHANRSEDQTPNSKVTRPNGGCLGVELDDALSIAERYEL